MTYEQRQYRVYLLRLWQAGGRDMPEWRIVLEDVRTHERRGFAGLAQLFTFLEQQLGKSIERDGPASSGESW